MVQAPTSLSHIQSEFYPTPQYVIGNFLAHTEGKLDYSKVLEPCAGSGSISSAIKTHHPSAQISQVEIREEEQACLEKIGSVEICDFLKWQPQDEYTLVITNPPFSRSQEIVQHCLDVMPGVPLIMFLRLNFLASKKRRSFINSNPPSGLVVVSQRPSFTPMTKQRDVWDYGFFAWGGLDGIAAI